MGETANGGFQRLRGVQAYKGKKSRGGKIIVMEKIADHGKGLRKEKRGAKKTRTILRNGGFYSRSRKALGWAEINFITSETGGHGRARNGNRVVAIRTCGGRGGRSNYIINWRGTQAELSTRGEIKRKSGGEHNVIMKRS